jgi:hypothetical protein
MQAAHKYGLQVLYSCPHHVQPEHMHTDVLLLDDCLAVVCHDRYRRKSYRHRLSLALTSCLVQSYFFNLNVLWDLIARSITFTGTVVQFCTQHIITFPIKKNSLGVDSYIIYQVSLSTSICPSFCLSHNTT